MSLISDIVDRVIDVKYIIVLNIKQTFNRIRMHSNNKNLIIFVTALKFYKYIVLLFDLIGNSRIWQHYINDILFDYLVDFGMIYINDILIYSKILKKHRIHVKNFLIRLQKAELQTDIDKCQFHQTEMKFLELLIKIDDVRIN